jgi:DHA2 family multidrug resistance protein
LGLGMVFVPLSTLAFSTLPPHYSADAAGIFSLLRTIGSSVGISVVATVLTRHTQTAWNQIGGHITAYNPAVQHYLGRAGLDPGSPLAAPLLGHELARQASMVAFVDCFVLVTWSFVLMLPLVFLMKHTKPQSATAQAAAAMD